MRRKMKRELDEGKEKFEGGSSGLLYLREESADASIRPHNFALSAFQAQQQKLLREHSTRRHWCRVCR